MDLRRCSDAWSCLEQKEPESSKKYRWIDAAVSFKYARGCDFLDGGISHAGGIGLSLLNGLRREHD